MKMHGKKVVVLILLVFCVSCSGPDEQKKQSAQEKAAVQIGHETAEEIKATINSAEMARQTTEQHDQQMQELLEQQEQQEPQDSSK